MTVKYKIITWYSAKKNNDNDDGILIFQLEINIDNLKVAS